MDGTLTHAVHDFEVMRLELGLAPGAMILEVIAELPEDEAKVMDEKLFDMELKLAQQATPQPGAAELLTQLKSSNRNIGILTRNSEKLVEVTLGACGLLHFFNKEDLVGREHCAPKPQPDGIFRLLEQWQVPAKDAVIVGDFRFDLEAGRAAKISTIHFDQPDTNLWAEFSDFRVTQLNQLTLMVQAYDEN
ncbi:MAG: HAD superfamily hydrolase (TIGR01509 family) [Parasphingorhabdus sp.]|jgi:HAD superfamily hydrolase (TIGR01509 family)